MFLSSGEVHCNMFFVKSSVHCDVLLSSVSCCEIRFDHLTSSASIVSSFVPQVYRVAAEMGIALSRRVSLNISEIFMACVFDKSIRCDISRRDVTD